MRVGGKGNDPVAIIQGPEHLNNLTSYSMSHWNGWSTNKYILKIKIERSFPSEFMAKGQTGFCYMICFLSFPSTFDH